MNGRDDRYSIRTRVSGDVVVTREGTDLSLSPIQRRIVTSIATRGAPTPLDELIDAAWSGRAPATAVASLHNHLSRLRSRAPGLVVRLQDHYCFGEGVDVRPLVEPPDRTENDSLADLRRRVDEHPHDEHAAADLVVALATGGDQDAALRVLDRVRSELAEVGLDAGRRIADLSRMVADGEQRAERLAGVMDTGIDIGLMIGAFDSDATIAATRRWLARDNESILAIGAPAGSGRSHALRVVRDLAVDAGLEPIELRCTTTSALPVLPTGSWHGRGPRLLVVDDLGDIGDSTARMLHRLLAAPDDRPLKLAFTADDDEVGAWVERLRSAFDRPVSTATIELTSWTRDQRHDLLGRLQLSDQDGQALETALDGMVRLGLSNRACLDAIRLATGSATDRAEFERIVAMRSVIASLPDGLDRAFVAATVTQLDADEHLLVELVSLSATPFLYDDLAAIVPNLRDLLRRGSVRRLLDVDEPTGRVATRHRIVDAVLLDRMSPRRTVELNTLLARAAYEREAPHLRARRHAAHAAAADRSQIEAAASMSSLADAIAVTGDRLTAADISLLAADVVMTVDPVRYCELAVRAGRELLSAGDPTGLEPVARATEVAIASGLPAEAAMGARAYCELGPSSSAGRVDEGAVRILSSVEPMLTEDRHLAHVLGTSTMVYALSGDADRCIDLYERALAHAEATGDDDVIADTLPFAFLSLAAPRFLERRESIAGRLHELADRTGRVDTRWEAVHLDFSNELQRGDPGVRDTLRRLDDVTTEVDGSRHDWEVAYLAAAVAHLDGRLADARLHADESLLVGSAVGEARRLAVYGTLLLGCHLSDGTVGSLLPMLEQMVQDQPLLAAWKAPLALALAGHGRRDDAVHHLVDLVRPGGIDPDCTMSAVALVAAEATARIAMMERGRVAGEVAMLAHGFADMLTPWSGRWSWTGAGTLGPIDTTLARLHHVLGNTGPAVELAAAAAGQAARMRAPLHARDAADLLVVATAP